MKQWLMFCFLLVCVGMFGASRPVFLNTGGNGNAQPPQISRKVKELCRVVYLLEETGQTVVDSREFQEACREAGVTGTFETRLGTIREKTVELQSEFKARPETSNLQIQPKDAATPLPESTYQTFPEIVVTNTNDSGPGSLRQAVLDAETAGGNRRIVFHLDKSSGFDAASGTWRIKINSPIFMEKSGIFIDGSSQAEFGGNTNPNGPEIILEGKFNKSIDIFEGKLILVGFVFILFDADQCWIRGFAFDTAKPGNQSIIGAILLESGFISSANGNHISDCYIGIGPDGKTLFPGGENDGIWLTGGSSGTIIENNLISVTVRNINMVGNAGFTDVNLNVENATIRNNKTEVDLTGTKRVAGVSRIGGNGTAGTSIQIYNGAKDNVVENNQIGGTRMGGIGLINQRGTFATSQNTFRNNRIGVGPNGENIAPDPTQFIPGPVGSTDPGEQGMYAVGIYATPQDTVQNNTIANFALCGIMMRDQNGNPRYGPGLIQGNTIRNCGMGVQIGQMTNGALVKQNVFDTCSQGGIVVAEDMFDAALIYAAQYQPRPVPNPTGLPSVLMTASENSFSNISGPGIALVRDVKTVIGGTYTPNTATQVISGFGPNEFQPTPLLTTAQRQTNGSITLSGQTAGAGMLEVYNSSRPAKPSALDGDVTAYGLGTFLQSVSVNGGPFTVTLPASIAQNATMLTATVTVNNQTSEFARTIEVQGVTPPPDTIAPVVTVTTPVSGQQIEAKPGTQVQIAWQSSDNVGVTRHDVQLARLASNGMDPLATGLPGTVQSFTWNVPENLDIPQAQIVVSASDAAGNKGQGVSGVFTVKKPNTPPPDTEKPVVSGVTLSTKKIKRKLDPMLVITWKSTDNVGVTSHDLVFADTTPVVSGLPGSTQAFTWTVPASIPKKTVGTVKVTARDAAGNSGSGESLSVTIK